MATTEAGARLTEAHRLAQTRIGNQTIEQMLRLWGIVDIAALDRSTVEWLRATVPLINIANRQSSNLSAGYLRVFREIEGPGAAPATLSALPPLEQLTTSLTVTGPIEVKRALGTGNSVVKALELGRLKSARAAQRHALNGGRQTILDTVDSDERALGWARTTSARSCAFCAMLASRGPVYKSRTSGGFKAHDHCHCGVEPVYSRDADWPGGARDLQALWNESTKGHSGKDAINAFRRDYEATL